ncbi:Hydroxyacylglutathione hydrolase [Sulfuracidifex tepidarius]|uniref:Hydroxyacylglutathione hydrolase n=1 Tax=Sulfuracidifex tepidarius TaxID=1294262 RepID=A0A510DXW8_9CREN|nr:MBL fold metallo-hydrolase [Sulfuracidifex tepidarius]BBG25037.1 Hydroxyacylglutathione hydrolase [Sulfuracidifex tepidarius]
MILELNLRFVKSFLVETRGNVFLVDSGVVGSGRKIISFLEKSGKSPSSIKTVVYTHSHGDHIGGASELKMPHNLIHEKGIDFLRKGIPKKPVLHSAPLKLLFSLGSPFFTRRSGPVFDVEKLNEGELFPGIQLVFTPGHTEDSVSIYVEDERALIVGDMLQGDKKGLKIPSIYEDLNQLRRSIEKVKEFKVEKVYVSHGISGPPRWPF